MTKTELVQNSSVYYKFINSLEIDCTEKFEL